MVLVEEPVVQFIRIDLATYVIGEIFKSESIYKSYTEDKLWIYQLHIDSPFIILSSSNFRQLLLCRVALGKSFLQFNAMKMAHAPPGHHSVVGRPSVGGLSFPEYVVYRGEQVRRFKIYECWV